ncbi:MAG: hypothetical protein HYW02_06410, partial [Deltaproteobacteria bacterium]|nr:hypothetical protein [Deltaproteobacteria bacterium]
TTVHTATITDDDATPSVDFTSSVQDATENAGSLTVTASLSAISGFDVDVPFAVTGTAGDSDRTVSAAPLLIPAGSMTADITVTLTNDLLDEDDETIVLTMGTPHNATQGGTMVHTVKITDDDNAPQLSINDLVVDEPLTDSFALMTVSLSTPSGRYVTANFSTANGTATAGSDYIAASERPFSFNPGETSKTIAVSLLGDNIDETNETIQITLSSPTNATLGDAVGLLTIQDTDSTPSVAFTASNSSQGESTGDVTMEVALQGNTSQTVSVLYTVTGGSATGNGTDYSLTDGILLFNPGETTKNITLSIVNDTLDEGDESVEISLSLPTNAVLGANDLYALTITDDDRGTVSLTETGGSTSLTEGGNSDAYSLVLVSQPSADVTILLNTGNQIVADQTTVLFTSQNWAVPQTITLSAVDDDDAEGNHSGMITHTVSSDDPDYDGVSLGDLMVGIVDNDSAGVSVASSGGSTNVTEGGATDDYTVVLTSRPRGVVTVAITSSDTDLGVTVSTSELIFNASNWDSPQTVTVTATNDDLDEEVSSVTISHIVTSASDTDYDGISVGNVVASVTDNDSVGISVTQTGGSTGVTEAGPTDSYQVVLTSEPTADVTITVTTDSQVTVDRNNLVFTQQLMMHVLRPKTMVQRLPMLS